MTSFSLLPKPQVNFFSYFKIPPLQGCNWQKGSFQLQSLRCQLPALECFVVNAIEHLWLKLNWKIIAIAKLTSDLWNFLKSFYSLIINFYRNDRLLSSKASETLDCLSHLDIMLTVSLYYETLWLSFRGLLINYQLFYIFKLIIICRFFLRVNFFIEILSTVLLEKRNDVFYFNIVWI